MEHSTGIIILLFIISALLIGSVMRYLLKNTNIPYTVALLVIGLIVGFIERYLPSEQNSSLLSDIVTSVSTIDPHLILFLFLPTLIFESAFAIESHLFRRTFTQISLLAVPGLILSTLLTAVMVKYLFPWDWSWPLALMFGALISATDPVAVVALLKEISSRKRLETLIEGESLLNDGTAIVMFTLFYTMITVTNSSSFDLLSVSLEFLWVVSLGLIIGLLLGWIVMCCGTGTGAGTYCSSK